MSTYQRTLKLSLYGLLALFVAYVVGYVEGMETERYRAYMEMDAIQK